MDNWMTYFLEVNTYFLIIGLMYHFAFRKNQNFRFGRPFLLIGSFISFILPLLRYEKLAVASQTLLEESMLLDVVTIRPVREISFDFLPLAYAVLFIGVALKLIFVLLGLYKLYLLKTKSVKKGKVYIVAKSSKAFSFLNAIFIGEDIPDSKKATIYAHELIHAKKAHSLDILFIQFIQAVLWYNPIVYLIHNHLKELHEFEADQLSSENTDNYIELLLQQSFESYNLSFIHPFNSNHIKNRIMRMQRKSNQKISKISLAITLSLLFGSFAISQNTGPIDQSETALAEFKNNSNSTAYAGEEKKAKYPGGQAAMTKFFEKEVKYPKVSKNEKSEGTVFVSFLVGTDGTCKDFKIKKGVSEALNKAAMDALVKMPKWIPGTKDGKIVAMEMTVPIKFVLPPPPPPAPPVAKDPPPPPPPVSPDAPKK